MKPPHADPKHPAHDHYDPMSDDYPESEVAAERHWREQGGVDPNTGKMWLTPRMERNAIQLAESLANAQAMASADTQTQPKETTL